MSLLLTLEDQIEEVTRLQEEVAFLQLENIKYQTLAEKHNCASPKELSDYIDQLLFYIS
jgi:hypothetical protein